jgi:alpha-ketoglutarate-dependent taurine dioxygenase
MSKSRIAWLHRLYTNSQFRSVRLRSISSSCLVQDGQQSFFKSKLSKVEGEFPGEKWFPNLASPPPPGGSPGEEVAQKLQIEDNDPVWRAMLTRGPQKKPVVQDELRLFREDGTVTIDPVYLRDSCRCTLCVDGSTLQRKFLTAHIPPDIEAVFHGQSNHGRVRVRWKNDIAGYPADHESVYSQPYLRYLTSPSPDSAVARKRHYWDKATFEKRASLTRYADFMTDTEAYKAAMSALHRDGLIFITDVDADKKAVENMAERIGPIRSTFYGSTWDVRSVADSKNVAYTNQHLGFHMDLLYLTNPPGYQLLHCLKNSCSGGESRFADSFFAATRLRRSNEKAYRILCRYPVEWSYENDGQLYIQRRRTFHEVHHFIGSEENARRRLERQRNRDNDADLAYVNWSPPFQGRLYHNLELPERTRQFVQAAWEFDQILNDDDMAVQLKMAEGTCAIFENRRVVHARNAFKTGEGGSERWLRGTYVDEDAFWSKCHALGADRYDVSNIPQPEESVVRKYRLPA